MVNCSECQTAITGHGLSKTCSVACRKIRQKKLSKEWSRLNPDKHKAIQKRTRDRRKEKRLEYGRLRASSRVGYIDRIFERVKLRTPDTDIDRQFLDSTLGVVCSVTNVPFVFDRKKGTAFMNPYAPSLDRIDSEIGYYKNNVQWVLSVVNFAKNQMSMEEFKSVWKDILLAGKLL